MTAVAEQVTLRWSSVRSCPRKAVYEVTGAPGRDRTDKEERILFRGRRLGRDYADWLAAKYGEKGIERERKVTWPLGTGHIDVYLPETRTAIEVLSSAHASESMIRSKLLQLIGYMKHDDDVDNGVLVILNPASFDEDRVIVSTSSKLYKDLEAEADARIAQVLAWRDTAEIPVRVCAKPSDAFGHFCLYAEHCFDGWQPPTVEEITAGEDVLDAVAKLSTVKARRKALGKEDRVFESEQKQHQKVLEEADFPAGTHRVGSYEVRRTPITKTATFDWQRAESAGVFSPEAFAEFFKPGASYSTFDVEQVAPSDFGDEAPWTDADLDG